MPRNITVYIPDELDERMKACPEVNWSEVCREGIDGYLSGRAKEPTIPERLNVIETDLKLLKGIQTVEIDIQPLMELVQNLASKLENLEASLKRKEEG